MENFTLQTCQTCSGYGALPQPNGSLITCQTCQGKGEWLETPGGHTLSFNIPPLIEAKPANEEQILHFLRLGWISASCLVLGASAIGILASEQNLASLIWNHSVLNAVFGLSGLSSIVALSVWQARRTSTLSLHDLDIHWGNKPELELNAYSNPRVLTLFDEAARIAAKYNQVEIDPVVLLITLLNQPHIKVMLRRLDIWPPDIVTSSEKYLSQPKGGRLKNYPFSPAAKQFFLQGSLEAINHGFPYIDSEDILLAIAHEPGELTDLFKEYSLDYTKLYDVCRWYAGEQELIRQWQFWKEHGRTRSHGYMNRAWTALPTPILDHFSRDLTAWAAQGALPSTQTREPEIRRMLEVLGRLKKNSLLLIGEPGIGKRTIIGGIASRIVEGNVPEVLKDKRLVGLDTSTLLNAGSDPEEAMGKVLEEIRSAGNVILVIPDVNLLVQTSESSVDAASLLVSAIENGSIQVISTATYSQYHRYIETSPRLMQCMDNVEVVEPSIENTVSIITEEAAVLENTQHVSLTYPAIVRSVELAKQYIHDKVLPSSALSLIDEAASVVRQANRSWVEKEDLEKVLEMRTNIPVSTPDEAENETLLNLETELHKQVIGQEQAIQAIADTIRRNRAGLQNTKRPMGSFLFVGPTGVGKTETAKAVTTLLFKDVSAMIRLDMSEYQDNQAIYRLIGPADISVEGSEFTRSVREKPYSVILLDEIEKASSDVLNVFLQVLDEGRLTENSGRTVNMTNCLIIATSNAGSSQIADLLKQEKDNDTIKQAANQLLQQTFRPEFLNRFDSIIPFRRLSQPELEQVTSMMLQEVIAKAAKQGYNLSFAPDTVSAIAQGGYDEQYGARPLRRYIQDHVESLVAKMILEHSLEKDVPLQITADMIQ